LREMVMGRRRARCAGDGSVDAGIKARPSESEWDFTVLH
jgi:hypothetical protein